MNSLPASIDIHTHLIPEHIPPFAQRFGYGGFIRMEHHCPGCARMMKDDVLFREIEANNLVSSYMSEKEAEAQILNSTLTSAFRANVLGH
jgi:hypothetical protein